ncbi:helix-turn-helix transcriptional regulator [Streptomyces sp. NPDC006193]|uniref:helix-turn-helix domain-containing protein n=1 Tax=Streptomyces sp. NPDC006193 TaxID=3155717 RepID=UPI0033AAF05D
MSAEDEVAEFAALLRAWKDRTGRSYGSLARRVGMNTSTLHRYCAGEAVPQDFAPVERLAAFCGATAEERLALHRHWLRALAARQRPRTPEAPDGDPTGTPPHPRPAPDGAPAGPPPADAASGAPAAADGRTHVPPADTGAAAPATDPAATAAGDARTRAPAADEAHPAGAGPGGGGPGRRRRYRRAAVAGAVTALAVALGAVSADLYVDSAGSAHSGTPSPAAAAGDRAAGDRAPAGAPGATPVRPTRSPSPSSSGSSSPSSSGGARRPASPERPGGPPPAARTTAAGAAAVPLTWTADSQVWDLGCDHDYVVAANPDRVPPPPAPQDAGAWAATQGAVHGHETQVRISVQGRSGTAVVVEGVRVRVVGRAAPVHGNVYSMAQGCGSDMSPRHFAVDLDKDRPVARPVAAVSQGVRQPAAPPPYRVSAKEPEQLLVKARTDGCDCRWYLELDWSSQGRTGTVRVDDHGRPFRTSAVGGLPHYWYGSDGGRRRWMPLTR